MAPHMMHLQPLKLEGLVSACMSTNTSSTMRFWHRGHPIISLVSRSKASEEAFEPRHDRVSGIVRQWSRGRAASRVFDGLDITIEPFTSTVFNSMTMCTSFRWLSPAKPKARTSSRWPSIGISLWRSA